MMRTILSSKVILALSYSGLSFSSAEMSESENIHLLIKNSVMACFKIFLSVFPTQKSKQDSHDKLMLLT
jgi:hypothetical protein